MTSEGFFSEIQGTLLGLIPRFQSYDCAAYFTDSLESRASTAWRAIVWWISRKGFLFDSAGERVQSSFARVAADASLGLMEPLALPYLFSQVLHDLEHIESGGATAFPQQLSVAYFRTDYWFGNKSGGSVGHVAGVANSFADLEIPVFFISSDRVELVDDTRIPVYLVRPSQWVRFLPEVPLIAYNRNFIRKADHVFPYRLPTLIYQRASLYNYSGAYLARRWKIPLLLEYNGSETWVAKNWGSPLRYHRWADRIETASLKAAHSIIVVSDPLKQELIGRGIDGNRILVNPNGVDTDRFNPEILVSERNAIRKRLGIENKIVIGFIGTFGPWHGAEVLADAAAPLVEGNPNIHFLMIGAGVKLPTTRDIIAKTNVQSYVTFTGMVPQDEGAAYLAACDILASPHVPNPDGSAFFGSPTKLFEYMSIGRGIVASRLGQIGEVLENNVTALLVTPGSVTELVESLSALVGSAELRDRLGRNARQKALSHHTWRAHTRRIIDHASHLGTASSS